ncbi:hypothetical protein V3C99_004913 [Haemonchus contortus]
MLKPYSLRIVIASLIILLLFGVLVFGLAWIFYNEEWRAEQIRVQRRYAQALKIDQERMLLSVQVAKMEKSQTFTLKDIEEIVSSFITTSYPNASSVPPSNLSTLYWTYANSFWFVICLLMSMEPIAAMEITSAVTHLFSMNLKIIGPIISVVTIASMAAAINWLFCTMLYSIAHTPKNLPDCLTAEYQRNLMKRDVLVMLLTLCLFFATFLLGVLLYGKELDTDFGAALCGVLSLISLTATFGSAFVYQTKNAVTAMLFWTSLVLVLQSSLAACLTSVVRVYKTWLTINDVVATPAELRAYLKKEQIQKRNQLIYHAKTE